MNKKLLKQLVIISYKNGVLDNETISKIADKLSKSELKQYIRSLKSAEKLRNVYVESPFELQKDMVDEFKHVFPDKKIVHQKDPSLLVGTRITHGDDIFEMNLKNSLERIVEDIENYD